jgi:hypothetical protein
VLPATTASPLMNETRGVDWTDYVHSKDRVKGLF